MGRVDCFAIDGLELYFLSNDHEPQHFHVRKPGQWMIKVKFLLCVEGHLEYEQKYPRSRRGPTRAERKLLLASVLEHREALTLEWYAKICQDQ